MILDIPYPSQDERRGHNGQMGAQCLARAVYVLGFTHRVSLKEVTAKTGQEIPPRRMSVLQLQQEILKMSKPWEGPLV